MEIRSGNLTKTMKYAIILASSMGVESSMQRGERRERLLETTRREKSKPSSQKIEPVIKVIHR